MQLVTDKKGHENEAFPREGGKESKMTPPLKVCLVNITLLGWQGANVDYHLSLPESGGLMLLVDI